MQVVHRLSVLIRVVDYSRSSEIKREDHEVFPLQNVNDLLLLNELIRNVNSFFSQL